MNIMFYSFSCIPETPSAKKGLGEQEMQDQMWNL